MSTIALCADLTWVSIHLKQNNLKVSLFKRKPKFVIIYLLKFHVVGTETNLVNLTDALQEKGVSLDGLADAKDVKGNLQMTWISLAIAGML